MLLVHHVLKIQNLHWVGDFAYCNFLFLNCHLFLELIIELETRMFSNDYPYNSLEVRTDKYLFQFVEPEKVLRHEDLRGAPVLILANKQVISCFNFTVLYFSTSC